MITDIQHGLTDRELRNQLETKEEYLKFLENKMTYKSVFLDYARKGKLETIKKISLLDRIKGVKKENCYFEKMCYFLSLNEFEKYEELWRKYKNEMDEEEALILFHVAFDKELDDIYLKLFSLQHINEYIKIEYENKHKDLSMKLKIKKIQLF